MLICENSKQLEYIYDFQKCEAWTRKIQNRRGEKRNKVDLKDSFANIIHSIKPLRFFVSTSTLGFLLSCKRCSATRAAASSSSSSSKTAAVMGRMHSRGKGISASALPYKRTPPSWLKISSQDVDDNICKFAKKGLTPSQIGVILRDSHGIAQVKSVTGSKILRILKAHGLAPEIPEDLYHLIKKAVAIRKHLERNRKDKDSKFRLILVESRIHRLARYYKKTKKLPPVWKYESTTASTLVA
ncbi:40S ribosomal protein S13-2 [Abeliophyllum distichum]